MRKRGQVDSNQDDIVQALRASGCTVTVLSAVGGGVPDLLVGRDNKNYLFECKLPGAKLTPHQVVFHREWRGQKVIVYSIEEALNVLRNLTTR